MGITNDDEKNFNIILTWLLVFCLLWFLGVGNLIGVESPIGIDILNLSGPSGGGGGGWSGGGGTTPSTPSTPTTRSAALQFIIVNGINGTTYSSGNLYADISSGNPVVDLSSDDDSVSVSSSPGTTSAVFTEGSTVIVHTSCDGDGTGVTDHYDSWVGCVLNEGNKVYELDFDDFVKNTGGYKINWSTATPTGGMVQFSPGDTNYWNIGKLPVYPRASKSYITFSAMYSGTVLSTITDGTTFDTTTTGAADAALTDTDERVSITLEGDATNICYSGQMMTVGKYGVLEKRPAYLMVSTNMTAISTAAMAEEGWHMVQNSGLYNEAAFYKEIDPLLPIKGDSINKIWYLPIDSSGASSGVGFYFKLWLIDFQHPDNVKFGYPSTSIPSTYGLITEFGIDAVIYARAFSVSSGVAGNQVLSWVMTTP